MQGLKTCLDSTGYVNNNAIDSKMNAFVRNPGKTFRQILESSLNSSITHSDVGRIARFDNYAAGKVDHATGLEMIQQLNKRNSELHRLLEQVINGKQIETGDMLALQGLILNLTRDITAVSKVVESIMTGLKTILQTQV